MDGESVSEVLTESAAQVYQYISDMQYVTDPPLGVSITGVTSYDVGDGFAVLHIDGRMPDPNGLMLMVDDLVLREDEAGFDRYDETSRTMVVRPDVEVLRKMAEESPKVFLLADMRFLVSAVGEFYRFASAIGLNMEELAEVVKKSAGGSTQFDRNFFKMVEENYKPTFTLALLRKDMGIALQSARKHPELSLPLSRLAYDLYRQASAYDRDDCSSIARLDGREK